uniref:Uncharacterized protein n=1 Tax=Aegilops tauschii subsp. strangulata TaxID=200361 RepID=A0A452Z6G3_AEGTS
TKWRKERKHTRNFAQHHPPIMSARNAIICFVLILVLFPDHGSAGLCSSLRLSDNRLQVLHHGYSYSYMRVNSFQDAG